MKIIRNGTQLLLNIFSYNSLSIYVYNFIQIDHTIHAAV